MQIWLNHFGNDKPCHRPYAPTKPRGGGLWTSTLGEEENWLGWLREEGYEKEKPPSRWAVVRAWLLEVDPSARIYEIDTLEDLTALVKRFPDECDEVGNYAVDWIAVGEEYDGVHLTAEGQWATRMPLTTDTPFDTRTPLLPNLYGWDCESTYWYRWSFTEVKEVEVEELWCAHHLENSK